ncbi:acyltransferase family protein [Marinibactrum halimedae]|uniref:Acyltransferase n=1 Tax=Marinibactrum halimedae TaxID=1444977 RepID=A0AA37T3E5_9GAMM|nr:acyltransferase [Marinibactrum halimedae]MCD9457883.1 acyltransferase [Marinibactrum halimedae]GLS26294.1 acyltransferase [Marinibactrum halimedae]
MTLKLFLKKDNTKSLSEYATNRDNNFNLIRFIAASLVLFSHSFALTFGSPEAEPMKLSLGLTWGSIAVDIFFISSGFLICGSYLARKSTLAFAWARFLRIYPALLIAVFITVFGVGLYFTELTSAEYLQHKQTYKYLIKNSILLFGIEFYVPGTFEHLPYADSINGSLWTLPYELKMYILLVLTISSILHLSKYVFSKFSLRLSLPWTLLLIAITATILNIANHFLQFYQGQSIRLFSFFFIGAACYLWKKNLHLSSPIALVLLSLLSVSLIHKECFYIAYCITLPYLLFFIAYVPAGIIRKFNHFGDYSYGIYIYAFPIQQITIALQPNISVSEMIIYSFIGTLGMAILSWKFIEKKALRFKQAHEVIESHIKGFITPKWKT